MTERLTEALCETGVTKAELARRLGRTPGFVSQVFGGGRNLTLRTIADIATALSLRPSFELAPDSEPVSEPVPYEGWHWTPRLAKTDPMRPVSVSLVVQDHAFVARAA